MPPIFQVSATIEAQVLAHQLLGRKMVWQLVPEPPLHDRIRHLIHLLVIVQNGLLLAQSMVIVKKVEEEVEQVVEEVELVVEEVEQQVDKV